MIVNFKKINYGFQSSFMPHVVSIALKTLLMNILFFTLCMKSQTKLTNIHTNYAIYFLPVKITSNYSGM